MHTIYLKYETELKPPRQWAGRQRALRGEKKNLI